MTDLQLIFTCCLLLCSATIIQGNCDYDTQATEGRPDINRRQFVDLDHPLSCSGSLTALHFCFYTANIDRDTLYRFYLRIYRKEPGNSLTQLHQREVGTEIGPSDVGGQSLLCLNHTYAENEYINVLEGDYIAVYVPTLFEQLDVVGTDIPGLTLYSDSRNSGTQFFFSSTILFSDLNAVQNTAIHISANVVSSSMKPNTTTSKLAPSPHDQLLKPTDSMSEFTTYTLEPTAILSSPATTMLELTTVMSGSAATTPQITLTESASSTIKYSVSTARRSSAIAVFETPSTPPRESPADGNRKPRRVQAWTIVGVALAVLLVILILIIALFMCQRRHKKSLSLKNPPKTTISNLEVKLVRDARESFPYEVPKNIMSNGLHSRNEVCSSYEIQETEVYETLVQTALSEYSDESPSSGQHQNIDQDTVATYTTVGPEVDLNNEEAAFPATEMHYEMDIFNVYSGTVSVSNGDLTTRIRKVMSSLKDKTPVPYHVPASEEKDIYTQLSLHNPTIHIPTDKIRVSGHLGSGQFALVRKGKWFSNDGVKDVAIKTLHRDAGDTNRVRSLQEAAIMAQFHHPNVVLLHGIIITKDNNVSLVMELLHGGDLEVMLKKRYRAKVPHAEMPRVLLNYCIQVTLGMLYLSEKGFVHRDIAARNVLVSDRDVCKIGDFGMSRDLEDSNYYCSEGGTIPVKWTAPEAVFYRRYSTASDVWSFGCLLYEIWSLGEMPFSNILNTEVLESVIAGFRLPPPPGCPYELYNLMIDCWNPAAADRPCFKEILMLLIGDEEQLLTIPFEDASTDKEAFQLGAHLIAGHKMYTALQTKYLISTSD